MSHIETMSPPSSGHVLSMCPHCQQFKGEDHSPEACQRDIKQKSRRTRRFSSTQVANTLRSNPSMSFADAVQMSISMQDGRKAPKTMSKKAQSLEFDVKSDVRDHEENSNSTRTETNGIVNNNNNPRDLYRDYACLLLGRLHDRDSLSKSLIHSHKQTASKMMPTLLDRYARVQ